MIYLSYLFIILLPSYAICWFFLKGDAKNNMNAFFGFLVSTLYICSRFRIRYALDLNENIIFLLLGLFIMSCVLLLIRSLLIKYKPHWLDKILTIQEDFHTQTFKSMHRVLLKFSFFFRLSGYLTDIFPKGFRRVICFVLLQIIPMIILVSLFIFEGTQGYFNLALNSLVLLTIPLLLKIWVAIRIDCLNIAYNQLYPVFNTIVADPNNTELVDLFDIVNFEIVEEAIYNSYEDPNTKSVFGSSTPDYYLECVFFIIPNYRNILGFKNVLGLTRLICFLVFYSIISLIIFLNVGPMLTTNFLYWSYTFLIHFFYNF